MKKERERKEYLEFVEQFQAFLILMTEEWGAKVTLQKDGEEEEPEDLLVVELRGDGPGIHIQRFHMAEIYQDFRLGKTMEELLSEASDCLERCREIEKSSPLGHMEDYESIREYLVIRPLNYEKNAEKLKEGVCEMTGDIALTLYVSIGNFSGLYTSSMVPKVVFDGWNRSREQVMKDAMENTYRLFPPRLFNWLDVERFEDEDYGIFMERDSGVRMDGGACATFVTPKSQINGAVAIFLPGVAKRLGEMMGNDLYIAFTSMHEAAIHNCEKVYPETIRESLKDLNREMPSDDDFLSGKVYYYNRGKDRIEVVLEY